MALSVSITEGPFAIGGGLVQTVGTITFDSSYPTGGEAISANSFRQGAIINLQLGASENGYVYCYKPSTGKILARWVDTTIDGAPLAEVTAGTNLSAEVVPFISIGRA